eukprot:3185964-Rhodomonas_salina.1
MSGKNNFVKRELLAPGAQEFAAIHTLVGRGSQSVARNTSPQTHPEPENRNRNTYRDGSNPENGRWSNSAQPQRFLPTRLDLKSSVL